MSMSFLELLVALTEKMALLAAAALFAVLFPPLRKLLLPSKRPLGGGGVSRERAFAMVFGVGLSIWGSHLGLAVCDPEDIKLDGEGLEAGGAGIKVCVEDIKVRVRDISVRVEDINVRAIGVIVAAILGGRTAGAVAGLCSGIFIADRVDQQTVPWVLLASFFDGVLAGTVAQRSPSAFRGHRAFFTTIGVQIFHIAIVGFGLMLVGHGSHYLPAWPAHLVKLLVNAAGVMLFVEVSRLVVQREEAAVALVKAKAAADEAALESLRRRLEPHFLFNALNVLRATIRIDPARARELVSNLADLYRYLLSHPEDAPLQDEVNHARAYLEIESARLGDGRLRVEVALAPGVESVRVPALLLQPLVENAVKHGIGNRTGRGTVGIRARLDEGDLLIEIEDASEGPVRTALPLTPGASEPVELDPRPGAGIALKTLRQRLAHLHGKRARLLLTPTDSGMIASVRLPITRDGVVEAAQ